MKIKIIYMILQLTGWLSLISCQKFLDVKPDKKEAVLNSLKDCQAMLDDYQIMNASFPFDGEVSADNYYMSGSSWLGLREMKDRDTYIWNPAGEHVITQWMAPYKIVYNVNLVLETLNRLPNESGRERDVIKGSALFLRAYAFYQIAVLFAAPYKSETANILMGIPIRLSPDLALKSDRGTLARTYNQIITDLSASVDLLPLSPALVTRPSKAAAYAAMARTYLAMEDYKNAEIMAEKCLNLKNTLMDYNNLNLASSAPFIQFNEEVIFHSVALNAAPLGLSVCKVDSNLILSYVPADLRKTAFFRANSDNSYAFKGNYDGKANGILFNGLATDEIYLIRAECKARNGEAEAAMADLNKLMESRWSKNVDFVPFSAVDAFDALNQILEERRKELVFRGLRFTDLRRLNSDPRFAKTIRRKLTIEGVEQIYSLAPNDLRYTLLIPELVMQSTDMVQNPR